MAWMVLIGRRSVYGVARCAVAPGRNRPDESPELGVPQGLNSTIAGARMAGLGLLVVIAASALIAASPLAANSDTNRVLSIYNIHNKETVTVTYKRNGRYQPKAMKKLNWVMRDWRRNEATKMDPKLIDIIWEMHSELGSKKPVHLISGYRSRKTNNSLRRSRGGQARNSRHVVGKAADIHFPDVPVRRLRYSALVKERGGVGYYPTSALPFVHVDTGRVRHWPRIGRDELALLTKGRSKHIPRGGRAVTKADYRKARARNKKLLRRVVAFEASRRPPGRRATTAVASLDTKTPRTWSIPKPSAAGRVVAAAPAGREASESGGERIVTAALTPTPRPAAPRPAASRPTASRPTPEAARATPKWSEPEVRTNDEIFAALDGEPADLNRAALPAPVVPASPQGDDDAEAALMAKAATPAAPPLPVRANSAPVRVASLTQDDIAAVLERVPAPLPAVEPVPDAAGAEDDAPLFELTGWATAPSYDDEHAGELSYRPFPVGPFLTAAPSIDDPAIARLVHPDLSGTRQLVGRSEEEIALRFKPGLQYAELLWSDVFTTGGGDDVLTGDPALRGDGEQPLVRAAAQ
ncbi:MAG: DUF882 domain-containing protein [Pseudomonadota bacterium]